MRSDRGLLNEIGQRIGIIMDKKTSYQSCPIAGADLGHSALAPGQFRTVDRNMDCLFWPINSMTSKGGVQKRHERARQGSMRKRDRLRKATVGETRRIDKKQREEARLSWGPEKSNRGVGRNGDRRRL